MFFYIFTSTARYPGFLLAPAESFGSQVCPPAKLETPIKMSHLQGAKPVQCNNRMAASNVFIEKEWREQTKIKQKEMEEVKDNTSCILCKYVISTLDGMLEDKANEKEIKVIYDL